MNTLKGAGSILILLLVAWLFPPQNDPAFMSLPVSLRLFTVSTLIVFGVGAVVLFAWGMSGDLKDKP